MAKRPVAGYTALVSSAAAYRMTLEEFLAWEAGQELRYEFDGADVFAMAGGTATHAALLINLAIFVGGPLLQSGGPCRFYGSELKVRTGRDTIRYPDGFIACGTPPDGRTVETEPVIVFEVLSAGSQRTDRIAKLGEYRDTPSVRRYVMLESEAVRATVFARDGAAWRSEELGPDSVLALPEVGISVTLAELYRSAGVVA